MMRFGALFGAFGVWAIALMGLGCNSDTKKTEGAAPATGSSAAPATSGAAAAAPKEKAKPGKEINLFAWSEYVPQEVVDGFTKETGIKVNYETYASNEEMTSKLLAGSTKYDLVQPSEYTVEALLKGKKLQELDKDNIPNIKNVAPEFLNLPHDPTLKYCVPYLAGTVGIVVNTAKIKDEVKGYKDVFQTKYKGKIVALNDNREMVAWALATQGLGPNEVNPDTLAKVKPVLTDWIKLVKVFDSDSPKTAFLNGDVDIGVIWGGEAALLYQQDKKYKYILPEEGTHMFIDSLCVPFSSENKVGAEMFINYVLKPEVGKIISDKFPYLNPNAEARKLLSKEQLENPASYPPGLRGWLLMSPLFLWLTAFVIAPTAIMLVYSFCTRDELGQVVFEFTLDNFKRVVDGTYLKILFNSVVYAGITTVICLVAGYPVAYYIGRASESWRNRLLMLVMVPFWTSFLIRTYAWMTILKSEGLLNGLLLYLHVISQPLEILYTPTAVIIGLVYSYLPFMILPIYGSVEKLDNALVEAAFDLGAGPVKAFSEVIVPLTKPGIVAGIMLVFIPSIGMFAITDLMGGARVPMVGNVIQNQFGQARDWPFGAALGMTLLLIFAASYWFSMRKEPAA
jgi:ABC-type spermidine/putrescine transport system permease subunit I/ABC-type thiamine transport system substrate-binding protein